MFANRRVLVAVVAVFALVFALGVGWLVRTAATTGDTTPTSGDTSTSEPTDGGVPQDDVALPGDSDPGSGSASDSDSGSATDAGQQPGSGEGEEETRTESEATKKKDNKAPRPAKTVNVNGPQGGGAMEDSCRFFVNQFGITMKVKRVFLISADAGLYRATGHCPLDTNEDLPPGAKPCVPGVRLATGQACYTGVQLEKELRPGDDGGETQTYSARVGLVFAGSCESADVAPCSEEKVAREEPSESRPVPVEWKTATSELKVQGKKDEPKPEESSPSASASPSS
ncbi:hypothetical protein [Actinoplanes aureus]|uniref:Uncharacterized protein n=1 Tax=Actinoplanes aureus TaxID=2792083 RepID=A0A931CLB0_9ACTN|nr:hypothetical protein [Actinoplanes aureus]MBG0568353.1 hypothetical protein [Actinoplanes aureus]